MGVAANSLAACSTVPVRDAPEPGSEVVTELVAGETLVSLEERGGWLRVVVPGHPSRLDERGYPGWVYRGGSLVPAEGWSPDLVVARPNRAGLPLGALLRLGGETPTLPGGRAVYLDVDDTIPIGSSSPRTSLGLARSLLGSPYRWGGTDSTTGMDCSGMVCRVMQLLGVTLPRDSDDQFDYAPSGSLDPRTGWTGLPPECLVFFGEGYITHVGFYLGGGRYISAHGDGGVMIRSMTDDRYRGFASYERR